jgi:hypothetical protein
VTRIAWPSWSRIYAIATWTLIVVFAFFVVAHLVLTVLFYIGVGDTGVGYVLHSEWPAWLITIIDGVAAFVLWSGYRRASSSPWLGLVLTSVASVLMLASRRRVVMREE